MSTYEPALIDFLLMHVEGLKAHQSINEPTAESEEESIRELLRELHLLATGDEPYPAPEGTVTDHLWLAKPLTDRMDEVLGWLCDDRPAGSFRPVRRVK